MLITKSDLQSTIETIMKLTNKVNVSHINVIFFFFYFFFF